MYCDKDVWFSWAAQLWRLKPNQRSTARVMRVMSVLNVMLLLVFFAAVRVRLMFTFQTHYISTTCMVLNGHYSANNDQLKHATVAARPLAGQWWSGLPTWLAMQLTPLPLHLHSALECRDVIEDALHLSLILWVLCRSSSSEMHHAFTLLNNVSVGDSHTLTVLHQTSVAVFEWDYSQLLTAALAQQFKFCMVLKIHFISAAWPHGTVNNWLIALLLRRWQQLQLFQAFVQHNSNQTCTAGSAKQDN